MKTKISMKQFKTAGVFFSAHVLVVGFLLALAITMATNGSIG